MLIKILLFAFSLNAAELVYLGDSISAKSSVPYGDTLAESSRGKSTFVRYAVSGSNSKEWIEDRLRDTGRDNRNTVSGSAVGVLASEVPSLFKIKEANPGATFVIALGTNDVTKYCAHGSPEMKWIQGAAALAKAVSPRCVWLLPIAYVSGEFYEACKEIGYHEATLRYFKPALAPCKVIDPNVSDESGPACPMPEMSDGIHPEKGAPAEKFAKCEGKRVRWWLDHLTP